MKVSVILATYNQPKWLEKVMWGYAAQTHSDFQIVVADDGSRQETADTIDRLREETDLDIEHVWHEDDGFRKCRILNQALLTADGDYLIFSDGDCVPGKDFVATHLRYARRGRFLSGGIVRLPMHLSTSISNKDIVQQRATDLRWLRGQGMRWNKQCLLLAGANPLGAAFDRLTPTKATWNGHNASGWKDDLLSVNGFDERMGYGGEDRELGERLVNLGIRPYQIRHRAACVHLEHGRGYVDQEVVRWNIEHRRTVRASKIAWTNFGAIQEPVEQESEGILQFPTQQPAAVRRAA